MVKFRCRSYLPKNNGSDLSNRVGPGGSILSFWIFCTVPWLIKNQSVDPICEIPKTKYLLLSRLTLCLEPCILWDVLLVEYIFHKPLVIYWFWGRPSSSSVDVCFHPNSLFPFFHANSQVKSSFDRLSAWYDWLPLKHCMHAVQISIKSGPDYFSLPRPRPLERKWPYAELLFFFWIWRSHVLTDSQWGTRGFPDRPFHNFWALSSTESVPNYIKCADLLILRL